MNGLTGLDWGTSRLRAYRLDGNGVIVETREQPWGIRQLPNGGFDAAFADITAGWPRLPCVACGMVGSRQGWREMPYVNLPVDIGQLGRALGQVRAADGTSIHIVSGLRDPQGPDVMRGEETQLLGALARHPRLARLSTWILPGTHSKWVNVRDGAIAGFSTAMTGELFALLRQHSILGTQTDPAKADMEAFTHGVITARDSGAAGALSRLFSTRALILDGTLAANAVADYLSGLLIGEEWRGMLASGSFDHYSTIQLIGDDKLCARYRQAATQFAIESAEPCTDAAACGLWHIACQAGLVTFDASPETS